MLNFISQMSVKLVQKYLPSPFIFALGLTFITLLIGTISTEQSPINMIDYWFKGLWNLLGFSMQMALILVSGYALASAPIINRLLDRLSSIAKTPKQAIFMVSVVALVACWINWGFGLIVGAVFAKSLAKKIRHLDYPLLIASAYSGFVIWHGGLSGSIPLSLSTYNETLNRISAGTITSAIPTNETLFTTLNLTIVILLLIGIPLINVAMHPKNNKVISIDPNMIDKQTTIFPPRNTPAQRLDDSKFITYILCLIAFIAYLNYFYEHGLVLGLNIVIGLFIFTGLLAHKTPQRYMNAVENSIKGISGIVLLFPFYAGVMGIMSGQNAEGVSLSSQLTDLFVLTANKDTFPIFAFLSAGVTNIFIPSGGGQWAIQAPILLPAGATFNIPPQVTAMAIAWGDAWTNMIQPFWALPLLGIAGLNARAIMGYCLIILVYSGIVISGAFYFLT